MAERGAGAEPGHRYTRTPDTLDTQATHEKGLREDFAKRRYPIYESRVFARHASHQQPATTQQLVQCCSRTEQGERDVGLRSHIGGTITRGDEWTGVK